MRVSRRHAFRAAGAGLALLAGLALAGCSSGDGTSGTSPSESASPSASASDTVAPVVTPSETPTPEIDLASPTTWKVTFAGVGPLDLGASRSGESAVMAHAYTVPNPSTTCPAVFYSPTHGGPTLIVSQESKTADTVSVVSVGDGRDASSLSATERAASPATVAGIRVGSTEAAVKAAYPGVTGRTDLAPNTTVFAVAGTGDDAGRFIDIGVGTDGLVSTLTVFTSATPPSEYCG
ncbi:hypothetical protein [Frondihabitans australicus]|uniref:Uncharacterized protein n=1 Tax=Frondihabitans australicus TaxID=386892 RepID=A0A495IJY3_9MICO|nr:hypothetical protein [Frondihabitans australicus]RKR75601.1 hypothetical protein C8E83_2749 [Frondihabitans australicus]